MIQITKFISIDEKEIKEEFIRSSGPGGQNVNKVATAVQLRFNAAGASSLPDEVKERLIRLAGRRITVDGVLIITARRFRTQEKNREDALFRLISLIREACKNPKNRKKTKPTGASIKLRLEKKRKKSEIKKHRLNRKLYDE
jgi:ribosome-associated protein